MSSGLSVKTNFTAGQLSPDLYGRGDLRVFENGARTLQNVIISPTGGVSRRAGLKFIDTLNAETKLISFEFNTEQTYLLCFQNKSLRVYKNEECISVLETPWTTEQLKQINWTQSADTLLVVHPDVEPRQISRNNNDVWTIEPWVYYAKDGAEYCPYFNFYQNKESIKPSGTSGNITLTAADEIFGAAYVGIRLRINGGEGKITAVTDSKNVSFSVTKNLSKTDAATDWEEQAFSALRGYPISVTFHQDRMVIGGSKSLPNRLWLSKSSDLFNFDVGTGLDDEAIEFAILSDQVNAIRSIVSTRHLLVFTTGAEWMVSGEPLTPSSIKINRQTNVGSYNKFCIPPQNIDGATTFISQNGRQLREFLYTDLEQAYQARDLTLLIPEIINRPVEAVYYQDNSILFVILEDGSISCLTTYRTEEVNAWSTLVTDGKFVSVAVIGDEVYFVVLRDEEYYLEKLSPECFVDCGITLRSETPKDVWDGLDIFEGRRIMVSADGFTVGGLLVTNGTIELKDEASEIIAGLPYEHIVEPLPFMCEASKPYPPKAYRVVQSLFRISRSKSLKLDLGSGYFEVPLRKIHHDRILDTPPSEYSGDIELRSLGWIRDMQKPMWRIKSDVPAGFCLLSVVNEIKTKD